MTFLAPWQAITAAAIALPILAILYMLKLRRRPVVVSTTAFWEQAIRDLEVNVPLRWIRPSWLLLLQALALALLVLALGRPAVGTPLGSGDQLIILLDRSASMRAHDADGATRFETAKANLDDRLARLARSGFAGDVTIIAFASSASRVVGPTSDLRLARDTLARLEPTDETGAPDAAFALARALLAEQPEDAAPTARVIFASDHYPRAALASPAPLTFERVGPRLPDDATAPELDNVGIVTLTARRTFDDPGVVRLFARLVSAGDRQRTVPLILRADGVEIERRAVAVPPTTPDSPGGAAINFELTRTEPGVLTLEIDRADALDADNRAAVVVRGASRPALVLVQPTDDTPASEGGWILVEVLRELHPRALVSMSLDRFNTLGSQAWTEADAVVFLSCAPSALPARPTLTFGSLPPAPGLTARARPDELAGFVRWSREHPLLRGVSLDAVRFRGGSVFELASAPAWTSLADAPRGPMLIAGEAGAHRHIAIGFDLADTNWPVHVSFPLFIANAIDWLTLSGDAAAGGSFRAGEPVELDAPGIAPTDQPLRITRLDDGATTDARATRIGARIALGTFPSAGVYEFANTRVRFAINVASEPETLISTSPAPADSPGSPTSERTSATDEPREVWHWFVLAATILASAEWLLYAWRMRV